MKPTKNIVLTALLLTATALTSPTAQAQDKKTDNKNSKRFSITAGVMNARSKEDLSSMNHHAYIKPALHLGNHFTVAAEIGTTHWDIPDKTSHNISPSFSLKASKLDATIGFSDVNNQPFAQCTYQFNNHWSLNTHSQSLSRKPPQTTLLPQMPDNCNVAHMAMAEWKTKLFQRNKTTVATVLGGGISHKPSEDFKAAYKAMLVVKRGHLSAGMGITPMHPIGFEPNTIGFLQFTL